MTTPEVPGRRRPSRRGWPTGWPRGRHPRGAGADRRGQRAEGAGPAGRSDLPDHRRDPDADAGRAAAPALRRRRQVQALARARRPRWRRWAAARGGVPQSRGSLRWGWTRRWSTSGSSSQPPRAARPGRSGRAGRPSGTDAALGVLPLRALRVRLRVRHLGGPGPVRGRRAAAAARQRGRLLARHTGVHYPGDVVIGFPDRGHGRAARRVGAVPVGGRPALGGPAPAEGVA